MRSAFTAAILFAAATVGARADALSAYDDAMASAQIMDDCKIVITRQGSAEKLKTVGDAAWHQIWASLDEQNSAAHEDNGRRADFLLKERTEADLGRAKLLVSKEGCSALAGHAREILETYSK